MTGVSLPRCPVPSAPSVAGQWDYARLWLPGAPGPAELFKGGVARISVGTALFQSAYTYAQRVARRLIGDNSYADFEDALSFGEFNNEFPGKAP
jgi:hypothetical protein